MDAARKQIVHEVWLDYLEIYKDAFAKLWLGGKCLEVKFTQDGQRILSVDNLADWSIMLFTAENTVGFAQLKALKNLYRELGEMREEVGRKIDALNEQLKS